MTRMLCSLTVLITAALAGGCAPGAGPDGPNDTQALGFELMHPRPECSHEGHRDTWCTNDDTARAAELSGMEKRINALLDRASDPKKATITIAYFSFSNT